MARLNTGPRNAGTSWTAREDRRVVSLSNAGVAVVDVASVLGRSDRSIRWRKQVLGLTKVRGPINRLTPEEKSEIVQLLAMKLSRGEIAKKLNRPRGSIIRYVWEHKLAPKGSALGGSNSRA
jgi:IS30 family transposase